MKNNTNEKLTMNNETRKGKKIACLSLFTFLFSLFLFACINPFDPPRTVQAPEGTGYFALSINGGSTGDRTIQPATMQDDFVKYRLDFFAVGETGTPIKTVFLNPDQLNSNQLTDLIELPVGTWDLTVTAYVAFDANGEKDDTLNKAAARGSLPGIAIEANKTRGGDVKLDAIPDEGFGIFSWDIDYPAGASATITIDPQPFVSSGQTPPQTLTITDTPEGEDQKGKKDSVELRSGTYRVTFDLVDDQDRSLQYSEILQVYQNLTSHFAENFVEDYFIIKRVTKIELTTFKVETGDPLDLNAPNVKVFPEGPNGATFKDIVWSIGTKDNSDPDPKKTGAKVDYEDQNGVFYSLKADNDGRANAKVKVLATIEHGKGYRVPYVEELEVEIEFVQVTGISLNKSLIELKDGMSEQLIVTVAPPNATIKTVTWKPNEGGENIFIVDDTGLITAKEPGETFVLVSSVSAPTRQATCTVKVAWVPVEKITLSASYLYLPPGGEMTLMTVVAPPNATDKSLSFVSSDPSKVKVHPTDGLVEIVGGTADDNDGARITVTSTDVKSPGVPASTCDVFIITDAGDVEAIELNTEYIRLEVGKSAKLIDYIILKDGAENLETDLFWLSGEPSIASVIGDPLNPTNDDGLVTAHAPGLVTISVTTVNGGKVAECLVEVYEFDEEKPAVTGLTLIPNTITMTAGNPRDLAPRITITPPSAANKKLYWKSDNTAVADVDEDGVVTAYIPGKAVITVTTEDSGRTANCAVDVEYVAVESVVLNITTMMMNAAKPVTLLATVIPFNASDKRLEWSSRLNTVATVDQTGKVTYSGSSSTYIDVKSLDNPAAVAECLVQPRSGSGPAISDIKLNTNTLRVAMDGPKPDPLIAVVTPSDAYYKDELIWHSADNLVATVDEHGQVSPGENTGKTKIIVMSWDGGYSDECEVEVYSGSMAVRGITLNTGTLTLTSSGGTDLATNGRTAQLIATVTPDGATSAISWKTRNAAVATVDANGLVTAVANASGTALITATTVEGGFMESCTVTVNTTAVAVTGVRLSTNSLDLEEGTSADKPITSYIMPETLTGSFVVKWYSVNTDVATVDANGLVSAVAVGDTTIIATTVDGGKRENVAVRVRAKGDDAPAVTGVALNINEMTLYRTRTATLLTFFTPVIKAQSASTAANQNVYWSSSDTTIATVNPQTGLITALSKDGTVTIMATTIDGGFTDECVVTVRAASTAVTGLTLNMKYLTLNMRTNPLSGELRTGTILATVLPANAAIKDYVWYNSNPEVATLNDATGLVSAVAEGKTIIQVTTVEGGFTQSVEVHIVPAGTGNTPPAIQAVNTVVLSSLTIRHPTKIPITVNPEGAPNRGFVWSSSNTSVATVDADGVVKVTGGKYLQTATITATTVDGGKSNTSTVTIGFIPEALISGFTDGDFYMNTYLITQREYEEVMGVNPSSFKNSPASGEIQMYRPVENVNFYTFFVFCNVLSVRDGLTPAYELRVNGNVGITTDTTQWGVIPSTGTPSYHITADWDNITIVSGSTGYRIPTAEQWEYAARAGTAWAYYWGNTWDNNYGWIASNSGGISHEVGKKLPNSWGLYDMCGNLSERTNRGNDFVKNYYSLSRGGNYYQDASYSAISTKTSSGDPSRGYSTMGLRFIRPAP
jgi:uncharacterized protein YjdB